jgi:MFS family permease
MTATRLETAETSRLLPLLGWFTGALFFFFAWVLRVAPSVMVEELMRDFAVGAAVLGNLSAAYFYGYAGMQIPVGLLLDRFGPRRLMSAAAVTCGCGCLIFATAETLTAVTLGRFLIGASAAFSLVGSMAVAGQWFRPAQFALLSGLSMAMGMAGGVFGQAPLRLALEATDWRTTMLLLAAGGFLIGILAFATVRDGRRGSGGVGHVLAALATVMRHRQTWLTALAGLGATAPLLGFAGLWGVPFLQTAYALPPAEAATLTSLMIAGWGVGAPLFGFLSDRIGRRRAPILAGIALETLSLAVLVLVPDLPVVLLATLSFLVGFFGSCQIACYALVRENHPPDLSGTAIGFLNGMVTGAGALFQPLIGFCLDLAWKGEMLAGARVYDPAAYRWALLTLVATCLAALLCALPIRETYCRPVTE